MATIKTDKTLTAFLDLIAVSEGTSSSPVTRADGYDIIVSGIDGHHTFADYSTHPFALGRKPIIVREGKPAEFYTPSDQPNAKPVEVKAAEPSLESTASGRYQIIWPTWAYLASKYMLECFSPINQDKAALFLIQERHCENIILSGNISEAVQTLSNIWASFPGNLYNQGGHTVEELVNKYRTYLA